MSGYSNADLYDGILGQNTDALRYLYATFFPNVCSMVKNLHGHESDANDIFQEAIIIFYRKAKVGEIDKTTAVLPYLMATSKIIWLKTSRERQKKQGVGLDTEDIIDESSIYEAYKTNKRKEFFYKHFKMLSPECQSTLKAFFAGLSFAEMAIKLKLSSEEFARRKKYLCKEYLVKGIKNDPEYKNISALDGNEPF